jgi:hypothetical protein
MEQRTCLGCQQTKPVSEFNWKNKTRGRRHVRCRVCTRAQVSHHYHNNQSYYVEKARRGKRVVIDLHHRLIVDYLSTHPCVDCGEADLVCLEFDHVRGRKEQSIGRMLGNYPWAAIEAEIAKCEVRCANCHRRRTGRQLNWYRSL